MMKSVYGSMVGLAVALVATHQSFVAAAESGKPVGLHDAPGQGAFRHLQALQDIATANGGNRAAGTVGYDRSAEYVAAKLREAGYAVRFETFDFPFFEERTPPVLTVNEHESQQASAPAGALRTLNKSGTADVTARLRDVHLDLDGGPPRASTGGCAAGDLNGFERLRRASSASSS